MSRLVSSRLVSSRLVSPRLASPRLTHELTRLDATTTNCNGTDAGQYQERKPHPPVDWKISNQIATAGFVRHFGNPHALNERACGSRTLIDISDEGSRMPVGTMFEAITRFSCTAHITYSGGSFHSLLRA
ncbi:uncharacterized protein [Anoplolepis gracilipes]|uniref:uncharacterized protein n=1 Tax=Anoplolepis gracilipes TaxID=354296 RepID=UPI003B9FEB10